MRDVFGEVIQARFTSEDRVFLSKTEFLTKTFLNQDFYTLIGIGLLMFYE